MNQSRWIKCIATHGNIRGVAIEATELVQELVKIHGNSGEGAKLLGEAVMGSMLYAAYCKVGERINFNIRSTGWVKQALVDAYPEGIVRGYVIERGEGELMSLKREDGSDLGPWGGGMLSVLRTKVSQHQPYIGTVPLLTGHLAKDLSFYWAQSEQLPSAVGLVVNLDTKSNVSSAGGFLIQAMPGADLQELKEIESHINDLRFADQLKQDTDPVKLLSLIFQSTPFTILEEKPVKFECHCSWERVERALMLVGVEELKKILKDDAQAEVKCDFCSKVYNITKNQLEQMIESIGERSKQA